MRRVARIRGKWLAVPLAVALANFALATWVSVAHSYYHRWEEPTSAHREHGQEHPGGPVIASVCPICSVALGTSAQATIDPHLDVFAARDLPFDLTPAAPDLTSRILTPLPRGPPLA